MSYTYDGNGLRVVKSVQGGTTTVSIFSGSSVIAEYDNGAAPTLPSREYIYNPAGGATTGLLAMISGCPSPCTTTYYHQDHLSVRLTTDASGNPVTQEGHFPFGELWYETGPTNKWFFTSYDRDSESGLDYALARYYDSRTGTFCSADPLAGDPSDPQSWNRYPYGRNDPIDVTDPSGQFIEFLLPFILEFLQNTAIVTATTAALPDAVAAGIGAGGIGAAATVGALTGTGLPHPVENVYVNATPDDGPEPTAGTPVPPILPMPTPTTPQPPMKDCPPTKAHGVENNLPTRAPNRTGAYRVPETPGTAAIDRSQCSRLDLT